jgi:NADH:ubiquinone oxidoreductase subunit 2 (subunit N)
VVVAMYMRDPVGEDDWAPVSASSGFALAFSAGVALVLGVWPAPLLKLAHLAAQSLISSF